MKKLTKLTLFEKHCEDRKQAIRKAKAIVDKDVVDTIKNLNIVNESSDFSIIFDQFAFLKRYDEWIHSSEKFKIKGLDKFKVRLVTNGITDAFNDFYIANKTISVMQGEYTYHRDLGYPVLDNIHTIPSYTALIISYPFSATGNVHPDWEKIMKVCEDKKIKVFVDCCLFGVAEVPTLDLNYDCITDVAFSFSKTFATGGLRTGVLYRREERKTPLELLNSHFYTQMAGMKIHYELMNKFSPDYMCNKYRQKQIELAKELEIEPSDSVIFGISKKEEHDYFERDGYINRLCLSYGLQEFNKPFEDFK